MRLRTRLIAALACGITALGCFAKDSGENGLPYWAWALVGIWWSLATLEMLVAGHTDG